MPGRPGLQSLLCPLPAVDLRSGTHLHVHTLTHPAGAGGSWHLSTKQILGDADWWLVLTHRRLTPFCWLL
jgi:hypothetical protein